MPFAAVLGTHIAPSRHFGRQERLFHRERIEARIFGAGRQRPRVHLRHAVVRAVDIEIEPKIDEVLMMCRDYIRSNQAAVALIAVRIRWVLALRQFIAARANRNLHALRQQDAGQVQPDLQTPVLMKNSTEAVVIVADRSNVHEHELTSASRLFVVGVILPMPPENSTVCFINGEGAAVAIRFAGVISKYGIEMNGIVGSVFGSDQRVGEASDTIFPFVERISKNPILVRISVRHDHFGKGGAMQDRPQSSAVIATYSIKHEAFPRMQRVTETPILPANVKGFARRLRSL